MGDLEPITVIRIPKKAHHYYKVSRQNREEEEEKSLKKIKSTQKTVWIEKIVLRELILARVVRLPWSESGYVNLKRKHPAFMAIMAIIL